MSVVYGGRTPHAPCVAVVEAFRVEADGGGWEWGKAAAGAHPGDGVCDFSGDRAGELKQPA